MKILATSDIHGNKALIYLILKIIRNENIDAIIIAGDITPKGFYQFNKSELKHEIDSIFRLKNKEYLLDGNEWQIKTRLDLLGFIETPKDSYNLPTIISKQMEQLKQICILLKTASIPVFMLIGNDDHIPDREWDVILEYHKIGNLNLRVHNLEELKLIGFQYVLPTPWNTNNELTEKELDRKLTCIEGAVDRNTILVTHSPPKNILDKLANGQSAGSRSIYNLVINRQPIFHIFGHIHEAFGSIMVDKRFCCNVSCLWDSWVLRGYILDTNRRVVEEIKKDLLINDLENICNNFFERELSGW